jgi:sortase, srtB family
MLFGVCIYARKWRILEDEQLKVQILSNEIQPQKENDKLCINMHAWNELKKRNPDFWAWIYWQNGIVSQPVVIDTGGKEYLYQDFDGKPSVCGTPMIFETKSKNKIIYGHHVGYGAENAVFTRLAELSDKKLFYEYQSFYLCMQDKIEEYKVFLIAIKNKKLDWNYQQKDFSSAEKFYEWIADAKRVSVIYDTDIKPRYSDEFVTIQTCLDAYSSKRVVLLAVKVKEYPIQKD